MHRAEVGIEGGLVHESDDGREAATIDVFQTMR
jgi:hypothetical protein